MILIISKRLISSLTGFKGCKPRGSGLRAESERLIGPLGPHDSSSRGSRGSSTVVSMAGKELTLGLIRVPQKSSGKRHAINILVPRLRQAMTGFSNV